MTKLRFGQRETTLRNDFRLFMTEVATRSILAEPFDDLEQQHEAAKLGIWIFLATEVLFFGGLFLAYTVYRSLYPEPFAAASRHTEIILGGTNTAILLLSSTLMALAVRAAHLGRRRIVGWLLVATATLGIVFPAIKGIEYHKDFVEHLVPGSGFQWHETNSQIAELFFWLYFAMTGLHAAHVLIGVLLLLTFAFLTWNRRFDTGATCRSKLPVSTGILSISSGSSSFPFSTSRDIDKWVKPVIQLRLIGLTAPSSLHSWP